MLVTLLIVKLIAILLNFGSFLYNTYQAEKCGCFKYAFRALVSLICIAIVLAA